MKTTLWRKKRSWGPLQRGAPASKRRGDTSQASGSEKKTKAHAQVFEHRRGTVREKGGENRRWGILAVEDVKRNEKPEGPG